MDKFDDMVMFRVLARVGTISGTAAELDLAPSAISRRLKSLEQRLGIQLVTRTTRQMTLTAAGEKYLSGATQILEELEVLEGGLQAGAGTLSGTLRLTVPLSFGLIALPEVLDEFIGQHPDVLLDIHMSDEKVDLVGAGFDLALRIGSLSDSSLIAKKLCDVDFALCAAPSLLDRYPNLRTPVDLQEAPACVYTNERSGHVLRWEDEHGAKGQVSLTPICRANNGDILRELAVRGHGFVCAPRFIFADAIKAGDLVPIFESVRWAHSNLYAVYPPAAHLPARVRAFIDHVADRLRRL